MYVYIHTFTCIYINIYILFSLVAELGCQPLALNSCVYIYIYIYIYQDFAPAAGPLSGCMLLAAGWWLAALLAGWLQELRKLAQGVGTGRSPGAITYNQCATSYKAIIYNQVATSYKATRLQDCRAHRECKAVSYKAIEAVRLHVIFHILLSLVATQGAGGYIYKYIYIYTWICIHTYERLSRISRPLLTCVCVCVCMCFQVHSNDHETNVPFT